jgi:hypothetical protein
MVNCSGVCSKVAFKFSLRHYNEDVARAVTGDGGATVEDGVQWMQTLVKVGPARCHPPRHRMSLHAMSEDSKCVG